jgi:hypothetical protein
VLKIRHYAKPQNRWLSYTLFTMRPALEKRDFYHTKTTFMKQLSIISTMLLLSVAAFFACNKQAKTEFQELDEAQFIQTAKGEIVRFTEDEDFAFSSKLAKKLGFSKITLAKGTYEISTSTSDFGTVTLSVKEFERLQFNARSNSNEVMSSTAEGDDGIGIRIAKRKKRTCGGEPVTCTCCCGIGFRCGTTSYGDDGDDDEEEVDEISSRTSNAAPHSQLPNPRRKKAHFSFNENDRTLTIHFVEKVDWRALN